ncbi:MAG: GAK system ATP-grasp enzyme [Desulfohalobiaceae bacterium]
MYKIGVVGTQGGWSSERLADAVQAQTGFRMLIDMREVGLDLDQGRVTFQDWDLSSLDGLLIKKIGARYSPDLLDRLEVLRFLFSKGVPIFSSPLSIMRVLDRLSCTISLKTANLPMPPTVITESLDKAEQAVREYREAIFKPLYTSKARGMALIKDGPSARQKIQSFKQENPIMYIQQKIDLPGCDLGLAFLGGEYLGTYARCNSTDSWNTTTANGGKYTPYEPTLESIELARQAQDLFKLDFTTVDLAETSKGPMIFEVSAFGGFRGLMQVKDIDAAKLFAEYAMQRIKES